MMTLCQQSGFLRTETITMSYTICRIFRSHCRNDVMPTYATHEENSIDAQNPNHICPLKLFEFVA